MSDVNRARAQRLLGAQQLDAVVVSKPESFTWATGAPAGVAAFFRRAGAAMALIPTAATAPLAASPANSTTFALVNTVSPMTGLFQPCLRNSRNKRADSSSLV